MSGTYNMQYGGKPHAVTFTPCGAGCATADWHDGIIDQAHLVNGRWVMDESVPDAIKCSDGSVHPGIGHYSWDPDTLTGEKWSTNTTGDCGMPSGSETRRSPISLTKLD